MMHRVRALFRAELAALTGVAALVATAASHALFAGLLASIVRGALPPFAYATYTFAVAAGLLALPLLGELGTWLRSRPAPEWMASLPARPAERAAARLGVALVALTVLSLGSLLPIALLAPVGFATKGLVLGVGLCATLSAGCLLLLLQGLLEGRAPALLVSLQTATSIGIAAALLLGLPAAIELAPYSSLADFGSARAWRIPSAWFAAALGADHAGRWLALALAVTCGSLTLAWWGQTRADRAPRRSPSKGRAPLELALEPLRRLALRLWVGPAERGSFDLVYRALPREREVTVRTYPLLAAPLVFAWVAAEQDPGPQRDGLVALLLFTPGFYLPILLAHVPASASHAASWLLECSPADRRAIHRGAFQAVAVRYVLPLHLALGLVAWQQAGAELALRLALPATCVSLLVLRLLRPVLGQDLPLSVPPERAGDPRALTSPLMITGIALAVVAIVAEHTLTTPWHGLLAAVALLGLERFTAR
jgi:hypothetical protein